MKGEEVRLSGKGRIRMETREKCIDLLALVRENFRCLLLKGHSFFPINISDST